ncbi:YfjI family protein [Polynucleobacter rarus]|uniref:YfjI family protein n=1 Tax=Polynucleobacter rarus TaxID=556055 RepID=UPI000D3E32C7|nr:YfjI family protein [Polynucleobacter rarus]
MTTQTYVEHLTPIELTKTLYWEDINTDRLIEEKSFPTQDLPFEIREVVEAIADAKKVPDVLAWASIQSSISASCGGLYDVQIDSSNTHPITTNILLICESGDRKTSTDNMASKGISDWQRKQFTIYEEENRNYQAIKKISKDEFLPEPQLKSLIQGAITPQALIKSLKAHPEIYISSNEGGSFVGSHSMKEQSMNFLSLLNQAWDGSDLRNNTQSNGFMSATNPRATVNLSMQQNVFDEFIGNGQAKGMGTLARFLIAKPISLMGTRFYEEPKPTNQCMLGFTNRIIELLETPRNYEYDYLKPEILTLSPEAKELWIAFYNNIEKELVYELESIKAWSAKAADNASRLAAQFHAFKGNGSIINVDFMIAAIKVMEYFLNEQLRLEQSGDLVHKQKMLNWMIKEYKDKGFIVEYEIQQRCPNDLRKKKDFREKIIKALIDDGYIQRNGLDKAYIFVNPKLLGEI